MNTRIIKSRSLRLLAASALACLAAMPGARANDWINPGLGDWSNATNWNGGVPVGGTIGTIANGGTAVVSTAAAALNEAQVGNNGVAGNLEITNGGTLTINNWLVVSRNDVGGNTPLSTLTVSSNGVLNKAGDGFLLGDSLNCKGQMFVTGNGFVHVTGGWNGIGNGTGEGWLTLQDNAVYTLDAQDWNIGDYGASRGHAYIKDNATLNCSRFFVGKNDTTVGALWQSGGTINGVGGNANEWTIGGDASASVDAFGFYQMSAGMLTCPFNFQVGRYGKGVMYQSGGTNIQSGWSDTARFAGSRGVFWLTGGLFQHTSTGTRYMVGENGRGEVTVSGTGVLDTAAPILLANGTAFLNLNGGTLSVPEIGKGGGTAYLNFNGGTVKAKSSNPNFISTTLTEARIYAGNAIFDTAGNDITINQALLPASGNGVTAVAITDGGAGYMAAPMVDITGDGFGALAVAQIDAASGKLTNIVITCPGYNYSSASATLIGGGATTAASLAAATLAPVTSGGVVKNGAGTLTLTGANQYTGATVVNAGKVITTSASLGGGAYTVASGAKLGIGVSYAYGVTYAASLTLGTSALDFDLGNFGNSTMAALNVSGALTLNGPVTVDIADALPQIGLVPLLQYGSRTGTGTFTLGARPAGVQATLVDDVVNKTLSLNITSVGLPRWDGQAGGVWDIGGTTNWVELSTGLPTFFQNGAPVLFDDNALGTNVVNLVTNVLPGAVTVNNSVINYTLSGTGKISGATGLVKAGTGSLTLANPGLNDYTGPTLVGGGTLIATNLANGGQPSAIGKSSSAAANLVISNATLRYAGPAVAIDRGYNVAATNSIIDTESNLSLGGLVTSVTGSTFIKQGPAQLAYTTVGTNQLSGGGGAPGYNVGAGLVLFDGSAGPQVNHNQGEMWVGGTTNTGASLILSNTTVNIDSWFALGRGNGSAGYLSTATLYNSKLNSQFSSMGFDGGYAGNLANQILTLNGSSTFTNNDTNLGESGGSTASVFLNDTSTFYAGWRLFVGWHNNATGLVTVANSASMAVNAWLSIGNEGGTGSMLFKDNSSLWVLWDLNITDVNAGTGSFTAQDNARITANNVFVAKGAGSTGTMTIKSNAQINSSSFYVANAATAVGTVTQTGGTVRTAGGNVEFQIGAHASGTYNLLAGTVNSDGNWTSIGRYNDGTGVLNVSGGSFNHNDVTKFLNVGEEGNGTLNLTNTGLVTCAGDRVQIASAATAVGTVNLNGGTLVARSVVGNLGYSTFNFSGGVLRAGPGARANFMSGISAAYVNPPGAIIDTGTNNISIGQPLLDGGGTLTKLGTGTLMFDGTNTYTGLTTISSGNLGGNGVIAGPVTVASGAGLAPGASIGLLTVNNTLMLSAGSTTTMEMNKDAGTNDQVVGVTTLTYGGTLVLRNLSGKLAPGDTFKLFTAATYSGGFTGIVSQTPSQVVTWDTSKLTTDGTVKVLTAATTPAQITPVISGGSLNLSWPSSQTGWLLQVQTNGLAVGVSTNWVAVPASMATNQVSIPIDTTKGSVFFRLIFP